MKILRITLLLLIAVFIQIALLAQEKFERLYRSSQWDLRATDIEQTADKGYLILSIGRHADSLEYSHVNVTKLEPKGDIAWTKNYDFEEDLLPVGQLTLLPADSFVFTTLFKKPDMNKVVTLCTASGDITWSNAFGETDDTIPLVALGNVNLPLLPDGGYALFDEAHAPIGDMDIFMSRLDTLGNQLWARIINSQLNSADLGEELFDAEFTQLDSGFIAAGMAEEFAVEMPLLVKLDSLGDVEWGKRYTFNLPGSPSAIARSVKATVDTGYIVGGHYTTITPILLSAAYVMKVDSIGRLQWAYVIGDSDILVPKSTRVKEVFESKDGGVMVLGEITPIGTGETKPFFLKLQADGTIEWQFGYFASGTGSLSINQLIATEDEGFAAVGFSSELDSTGQFLNVPYVLKLDENGSSSCEDTTALMTAPPNITVDTLFFNSQDIDTTLVLEPESEPYSRFTVPVLSLDAPSFCEGEPILHTFDATIDGAVSYEWNTGETTPMITVMQEGMYTVFVRVEQDVCYDMCDTTMINIIGPPTAEIIPNPDTYCTEGFVLLFAEGTGTYQWSTGETASAIAVTELGTYSVTITNQCDSAVASYNLTSFPEAPDIDIKILGDDYCETGIIELTVLNASGANGVEWSTGETSDTIQITDLSLIYSVTADFGDCGTRTSETDVEAPPSLLEANIILIDSFCTAGFATLIANVQSTNDFEWSTGETTDTIQVTSEGTYVLTALSNSQFCPNAESEPYIRGACISDFDCVRIPNVFTPDSDSMNDDFWPVIPTECGDIQVTEMKIFSRWGELIYETNNPDQPWDGNYKGEPAGSDVYVYMIRMINGAAEVALESGDVTLLR